MSSPNSNAFSGLQARLSSWGATPYVLPPSIDESTGFFDDSLPKPIENVELGYETDPDAWQPVPANPLAVDHPLLPECFVDGKLQLHLVGGGRDNHSIPRPILAGQIGAGYVCLDGESGVNARRTLMMNLTDISIAEEMSITEAMQSAPNEGYFFLPYRPGYGTDIVERNFDAVHRLMYRRGRDEMLRWERDVTEGFGEKPVYVDGRVRDHLSLERTQLVIGVVKQMRAAYLHPYGYQVRDSLGPGQRTPVALLCPNGHDSPAVITFYMRLSDEGANPTRGIVRVELRQDAFESLADKHFGYLDALTAHLYSLRCQRPDYARAHVTTEPIYEAEQIIGAHFLPSSLIALEAQTFLFT